MSYFRLLCFVAAIGAAVVMSAARAAAEPGRAETCPGNPDALGTSRILPVAFDEYERLGTMQYPQTLPLADHEVVITFDDGPLPPWSDEALDILTAQCVKVTYFIVGKMAAQYPQVVRREYEAGNTIGTHSEDHPLRFTRLLGPKLDWEIDQGIASVGAALGDPRELSPFFRIPGLGRDQRVEEALAKRSLIVFSADVVADDWFHHISPEQIISRAMSRLEKRGRGILLLHDIHPATVHALPGLLKALKENGFHVVQVVPAETVPVSARKTWVVASAQPGNVPAEHAAIAEASPSASASGNTTLRVPDAADFAVEYMDDAAATAATQAAAPWPQATPDIPPPVATAELAAPDPTDLGVSLRGKTLVDEPQMLQAPQEAPRARHPARHRFRSVRVHHEPTASHRHVRRHTRRYRGRHMHRQG